MITEQERQLINAVVAEGLTRLSAGVVEKDLVVTKILRSLARADMLGFLVVFCGGTCLSKAHGLIQRMSEDLDFKVIVPAGLSCGAEGRKLSQLKKSLVSHFSNAGFRVPPDSVIAWNDNRYFSLLLYFESAFPKVVSLRTEVQVEFTVRPPVLATQVLPIQSMLAVLANIPEQQLFGMTCVGVEEMLAEKTLSLLRRTAELITGRNRVDYDPKLIRHLYDVHEIVRAQPKIVSSLQEGLFSTLVKVDAEQFGNQQPEFLKNPKKEMLKALTVIKSDRMFREHYTRFLDELVYGETVEFEAAIVVFERVTEQLLAQLC